MVRLIDADALKEWSEIVQLTDDGGIDINDFEEKLESMPTVDVVPVRHGKWFIGTVPYFVCSECKNRTPLRWDERLGYVLDYRSPYCPNCGAKMDKK